MRSLTCVLQFSLHRARLHRQNALSLPIRPRTSSLAGNDMAPYPFDPSPPLVVAASVSLLFLPIHIIAASVLRSNGNGAQRVGNGISPRCRNYLRKQCEFQGKCARGGQRGCVAVLHVGAVLAGAIQRPGSNAQESVP